jgi:CHASE2 domain-containing sensor protein/tRNA A-37 threonylcarbamoyl transferase component Bud32
MNSRAPYIQSGINRMWPAIALALIALAIGLLGRMNGLESQVYDYFQRYQYKMASEEILLLTIDPRTETQQNVWSDAGFRDLTNILNKYGARLIVATQPLSLPEVPTEDQIKALNELQRQTSRASAARGELDIPDQLQGFRDSYDQREALLDELRDANNVVLATISTNYADDSSSAKNCESHQVNLQGAEENSTQNARHVRYLTTPTERVCEFTSAVGVNTFWPDNDGVVRSSDLVVNADGIYLPSLALAAYAAIHPGSEIFVASTNALTINQQITHTGQGFQVLNRYYNGKSEKPPFESVPIASVLNGKLNAAMIQDRIVLVGETIDAAMPGVNTPVNQHMSPMEVTASNLSNIIEQDYLIRPDWSPLLETGLLIAILMLVVFWLPNMPLIASILMGIVLASFVVSLEAWLLVTKGIWLQLANAAAFAAVAVWTMHLWNTIQRNRYNEAHGRTPSRLTPRKISDQSELDLKFSVLRQQSPTDATKEQMYEIALIHGKAKEFARAERVLTCIADIDSNYKDVNKLLDNLSGAKEKRAAKKRVPSGGKLTEHKTFGRYEIDRVLGRGAMATVYLGRDPKINRKVAIKTLALAKEFDDAELEDARIQFRREAESAGRLNHPNIIAIYDAGEDEDVSFLAMEYFKGVTLQEHTEADNLLPPKWVLELGARAAEALDYAHRQNVVHRDIKPANVMYHAATDTLKLTDFGIARLTDSSRTKTGIILGTPSYMSPEQLTASGVTGQSDLYSLGVTMYQLLTGTAPFLADSIPKLMDRIMNDDHQPVSELKPDIPSCVDSILDKALAKNPADRFPNGREMAIQLRDCSKNFKARNL